MSTQQTRQVRETETLEIFITCYAPKEMFLPYEELPQFIHDELDENGGIPCEGGGELGLWCNECRFGTTEEY